MKLKSFWKKLTIWEWIMTICFLSGLIAIIIGVIILLNTNYGILNGFGVAHNLGIITSLQLPNSSTMIIWIKIGIILSFFIMPTTIGSGLILLVINKIWLN